MSDDSPDQKRRRTVSADSLPRAVASSGRDRKDGWIFKRPLFGRSSCTFAGQARSNILHLRGQTCTVDQAALPDGFGQFNRDGNRVVTLAVRTLQAIGRGIDGDDQARKS